MTKDKAYNKAMQIISIRQLQPNNIQYKRLKDTSIVRNLRQAIDYSDIYYSLHTDNLYAVVNDRVYIIQVEQ